MKMTKKFFTGLVLAFAVILALALSRHAFASGPITSDQLDKATYKIVNAAEIDGSIGGMNVQFFDNNPLDGTHNFKPKDKTLFCDGTLFGNNGLGSSVKGITLDTSFSDITKTGGNSINAAIIFDYLDASGNCQTYQNTLTFIKQSNGSFTASQQPAGSTTTQTTDNSTCEANSGGFTLAWVTCPLLTAAGDAITGPDGQGGLLGYFEDQLSFSVSKDLGSSTSQDQVKVTWGIFKNIATAVLVIVMLLMVYSQATGAGPFEAYTTRKMLPRLIAIAILMQLSWVVLAWVLDIFNDLGSGLSDLMYAPFGGSSNLTIFSLLSHAGLGTPGAIIINWVGIIALLTIGVAAAPTVLLFALGAAAALLTAFFVLIFRKIIIILCLITAPIALAAYLLPGAQRYWKLWYDNLLKVLAMYPLIVALIAAGRIFAYIVSTQNNGGVLVSFIFIIVGFFGPLFMLPKAFKWGGTLMSAGGSAISGAVEKFAGKDSGLGKGVHGYAERWQGAKAKQYNPQAGLRNRTLRRIQSGHILPTERSRRLTIASGNKWASERSEEAEALVDRSYEKALSNGYDLADMDDDGNFIRVERAQRRDHNGNYLDAKDNIVAKENAAYIDSEGNIVDKAHAAYLAKNGRVVKDLKDAEKQIVASKEEASSIKLTGVAAGKQALLDIAGNEAKTDAENRAAQSAHKKLLDTSSWIETQSARIQVGKNAGKRQSEVETFRDTLENSSQHYSATIRSRPDLAPDVIESAQGRLGYTYDQAYEADNTDATRDASGLTRRQRMVKALDRERLETTLKRLGPDAVPNLHFGFFEDIAKQGDSELSGLLANRLQAFKDSGTTVGANAIGSLTGQQMQAKVESALKFAPGSPALARFTPKGEGGETTVTTVVTPGGLTEGVGRSYETGNVEGGSRTVSVTRENLQRMSEGDALNWIDRQGGASAMSNEDLVAIYNNQRGGAQTAAREELQNRGLFNPEGPNLPGAGNPPDGGLDIHHDDT